MSKLHLVMPMGGRGSRFAEKGFDGPKPLLELNGKPFFFWSVRSVEKFLPLSGITFVVLREHVEEYRIDRTIRSFFPEAEVRVLPEVLAGAVLTCLEGVKGAKEDEAVLFNDCDHMFRSRAFEGFCRTGEPEADGAVLTFSSDRPSYGYVRTEGDGLVAETAEKRVISDQAVCGCYYFALRRRFEEAAERYLSGRTLPEYYLSGVLGAMVEGGERVRAFPTDFHVPYGTPEEYEAAKRSSRFGELL